MQYQYSAGGEGSLSPSINPEIFNGVILAADGYVSGDAALGVSYFEGKSSVIRFVRIGSNVSVPIITQITLRPAPTMTFLNPRPAPGSPRYPWRFDGGGNSHVIKLPVPLTFEELAQGSQIVAAGITEKPEVIEGSLLSNIMIEFRAGGLLIGNIQTYQGETDLITVTIDEFFTGEILAVNFDKAYKNLPVVEGIYGDDNRYSYFGSNLTVIANMVVNGVSPWSRETPFIPSPIVDVNTIVLNPANLVSGNVIEAYLWGNERYLMLYYVNEVYKLTGLQNISDTNSPLTLPEI